MKILTAFALAVTGPNSPEQPFHFKARRQPTVSPFLRRIVILPYATPQRRFVPFPGLHRLLDFQPDLSEDPDQKFVHVVIDPYRRFDKFAVVRSRHVFPL